MQNEVWKDCKHYEGLYQVSNYGRVRSVERTITDVCGRTRTLKGCYIYQFTRNDGYLTVNLSKFGRHKTELVHRLVAMAFIPNPDNKPQVNHKDEDKQNNYVENLEWATEKENINYGTRIERRTNTVINNEIMKGGNHPLAKKVKCNGLIFDCIKDCAKYLNVSDTRICRYLNKTRPMPQKYIDMGLSYA